MALTDRGLRVLAVDRDPLRVWMTQTNAGCDGLVADVASLQSHDTVLHIDPHRRSSRGRRWRLDDYEPGPDVIRGLLDPARAGAVKLGPGVDLEACRQLYVGPSEIELVSVNGRLNQAVLWTGELAGATTRATLIDAAGVVHSLVDEGAEDALSTSALKRFIYTVDPSIERRRMLPVLAGSLDMSSPSADVGLLTSDRLVDSPWLTAFELIEQMPWRQSKVKAWLAAHRAGVVEVKTRGRVVETDPTQLALRGVGDEPFTVFVLRFGQKVTALVARRLNVEADDG